MFLCFRARASRFSYTYVPIYRGYGHETNQCPIGDASPMTNEDLKNYMLYLKEEEERTMQN